MQNRLGFIYTHTHIHTHIVISWYKGTVSKLRMADKSMFGEKQTEKATVGRI